MATRLDTAGCPEDQQLTQNTKIEFSEMPRRYFLLILEEEKYHRRGNFFKPVMGPKALIDEHHDRIAGIDDDQKPGNSSYFAAAVWNSDREIIFHCSVEA